MGSRGFRTLTFDRFPMNRSFPPSGLAALCLACFAIGAPGAEPAKAAGETVELSKVIVTPSRFGIGEEALSGSATLTSDELAVLPQVGEDLYRTISRLPGLAADDFTAQFWVRGAPNRKVLSRIDGLDLIEPFHLKDVDGALSIVDLPSIDRLELSTGGFSAEFGDRLAGVLTMESSPSDAPGYRSSLGISLTGLRAAWRGTTSDGKGGWSAVARRGYPDLALRAEGRDDEIKPMYYDVSAKFEYKLGPEQRVSFHVLHAGDTFVLNNVNNPPLHSDYGSNYAWGRWLSSFASGAAQETVLSYSWLTWNRSAKGLFDSRYLIDLRDRRSLEGVRLRNDWTVPVSDSLIAKAGFVADRSRAEYHYHRLSQLSAISGGAQTFSTDDLTTHLEPAGTAFGAHAALRFAVGDALVLEPGLRFDRHGYAGDSDLGPRLNAALKLGKRTTLRVAWGLYAQSQGLHQIDVADGEKGFGRSEIAEHRILGLEHALSKGIHLRVEAYERSTRHPRQHWESLLYPYDVFPEARGDRRLIKPDSGRARGVEFLAEYRDGERTRLSASYALAESVEFEAGRKIPRARDQRNTLYLDYSYNPSRAWLLSAAWQYHDGWPITLADYSLVTLANGKRVYQRGYGAFYGGKLPAYHRLDLRATRTWQLRKSVLRAYLDIFNAYDRNNIYTYDTNPSLVNNAVVLSRSGKSLLPILPSLGLTWDF
jgi:hypothetical protein